MSRLVLLDSGPLGLLSHPKHGASIKEWMERHIDEGNWLICVPEITDYEVRRELIRARRRAGIGRLDYLKGRLYYLPLTTHTMLAAASLWAEARQRGRPTADPGGLDVDVILAAQARVLTEAGHEVVVATTNPQHLSQFVEAREWESIV